MRKTAQRRCSWRRQTQLVGPGQRTQRVLRRRRHRLRVLARGYGVLKIDAGPMLMNVSFRSDAPIEPQRIVELVQKNRAVKLAGNAKLRVEREIPAAAERANYLRDLLRSLGRPVTAGV